VAFSLYKLLAGVDRRNASLIVILIVVSVPIALVNELNSLAALALVRGADFLSIVEKPQRDAFAMLFLNLHGRGLVVAELFWGLWLFPLCLLMYRSRLRSRYRALSGQAVVDLAISQELSLVFGARGPSSPRKGPTPPASVGHLQSDKSSFCLRCGHRPRPERRFPCQANSRRVPVSNN
jgi:hypothetical protein